MKSGCTQRQLSKLGICHIWKKYLITGDIKLFPKSGRKLIYSPRNRRIIFIQSKKFIHDTQWAQRFLTRSAKFFHMGCKEGVVTYLPIRRIGFKKLWRQNHTLNHSLLGTNHIKRWHTQTSKNVSSMMNVVLKLLRIYLDMSGVLL